VLQTGRIALEGPAAELERNEKVQEIYLGVSTAARHSGSPPSGESGIQNRDS
jgi:hypothetical protein